MSAFGQERTLVSDAGNVGLAHSRCWVRIVEKEGRDPAARTPPEMPALQTCYLFFFTN